MRLLERIGTPAPIPVAAGQSSWRQSVLVLVEGPVGGDESLAAALPLGWHLARDDPGHGTGTASGTAERLVLVAASRGSEVARVRREHPDDPLLAMVPLMADSSVVVEALEAGADACIRTSGAAVVASYLIAMQRRREMERVADLTRL